MIQIKLLCEINVNSGFPAKRNDHTVAKSCYGLSTYCTASLLSELIVYLELSAMCIIRLTAVSEEWFSAKSV